MKLLTRLGNLLRCAHRTGVDSCRFFPPAAPLVYVVVTPFSAVVLLPFLVVEPESFDYPDHV